MTEFTQIDRPKKDKSRIKVFVLVILLVLFLGGLYYYVQKGSGLANHLPTDTKFYVSLSLPAENHWYAPFLFWQKGNKPSQKLASVYSRLNLISWDKVAWAEKVLPLLAGRIELASLPRIGGTDAGGVLLKAQLKDKPAWLALFGMSAESYRGEVQTRDWAIGGIWNHLTKNPNKIAWQILGNDLYLADSADVLFELNGKTGDLLASVLKKMKVKPGLALFYAKDEDSLNFDNVYIKALSQAATYPLAIGFREAPGAVNINVYGQKLNPEPKKSSALAERLHEFDAAFYAQNLASAYAQAEAFLPEGLKNNFWMILKDFYGITKDEALTEIGTSEIFLTFSGNDWLLNISDNKGENNNLLAVLKKAGTALFATTHPATVEHKLGDGTKMVELRADIEGLEWAEEPWSYASQPVKIESLKGQGESNGYFIGFVPEIGYILTTSMPLLNQYAAPSAPGENENCILSKNTLLGASWPVNNLTTDDFWRSMVDKIVFTGQADGKINGCAVLLD